MIKSISVRIVYVIYECIDVFYLTTSLIAVFIKSLYCIAAVKNTPKKFYLVECINKAAC